MKTACFVFLALLFLETYAQSDTVLFDADYHLFKALQTPGDTTPELQRILRDTVISILSRERKLEFKLSEGTEDITPEQQQILRDTVISILKREEPLREEKEKERGQYLEDKSPEELFRAAFKTEKVRAYYFMVRFSGDGKNFGNIEVSYDSAFADFTFYSLFFSQYLDSILVPEQRLKVNGQDGLFHSKQLKNLGFEINLDEQVYELRVDLPPEMKVLQRMNFGSTAEPRGYPVKPAFFSSYLNLYARESFNYNNYRYYDPYTKAYDYNRGAIYLDLDGAMALGGFILEGSGNFKEPQGDETFKKNIRRGDVRLVRDFLSVNSRLTLGDVGGVSNLMIYENMAGIRYEHNERMFDYNRLVQSHKVNFYLPRASQVEIHIDGKLNRRLFLPSGYHEIHGLTGHSGLNTVQIFVPDESGSLKEIRYDFELGDGRTLFKGESRYSLTSGIMRSPTHYPATFKYHTDKPGLNAEYIYGLFHSLSAGFLWQLSLQNMMTGLQFLNTSSLGYTELFGLINADSSSFGKRMDMRHSVNIDRPFKYMDYLGLSLSGYIQNSTHNPYLFRPKDDASDNFAGISGNISSIFSQTNVSASLGISFYHENEDQGFADLLYGIAFSKDIYGLLLNANATSSISKNTTSYHFSLGATYSFGIDRHNIYLSGSLRRQSYHVEPQYVKNYYYDEPPDFNYETDYYEYVKVSGYSDYNFYKEASLGWNWSDGGENIGGQSYFANVIIQDNLGSVFSNLSAFYYFNRMEMGIYSGFSYYENPYRNSDSRILGISTRASTSFMFADGLWAFGKPVRQGFMLADVDGSLSGSTVRVNYSAAYDTDYSRSGSLGAAYQNRIGSYRLNSIEIRLNDMPVGAWVEQNRYYIMGAYKQGYALRLSNDMRTFMQVRLNDERGALEKLYVAVFQLDSENNIINKRATFTAKDGTLQMGNLIPGKKYRLGFDPSTYIKDIEIEIPIDAGPFLELPVIKVERE
ncbi:MAG: hypothetical protein LBQ87_08290 [Candidatus Fibromonas sp.]|jgi:outer membrane usher protein FimD/PapC|nr:hypothetical protein [Candidatus Fibromonas sp.]